jgi:CxxC-x17-CxxC domain-containing protein
MERVRIPEDERVDFYLYVDEFQNFATDSFAGILSEARKYRLNLIIAHQYVGQLVTDVSTKVRDAVFGNVGTMIIFRVGAADAEFLEAEFEPEFAIQDLVNLPNYFIYLKLMVDGVTCRPFSSSTLPPFQVPTSSASVALIIEKSREKYSRPIGIVEKEIEEWSSVGSSGTEEHEATCDACGKDTTLPFKPTAGRPVYCRDCLDKVKSGQIQPVITEKDFDKPQAEYFSDLSDLGIELGEKEKGAQRPAKSFSKRRSGKGGGSGNRSGDGKPRQERTREGRPASLPRRSSIVGGGEPVMPTEQKEKTISLGELKPKEERAGRHRSKEGVDVSALQKAVRDALEKAEG